VFVIIDKETNSIIGETGFLRIFYAMENNRLLANDLE
jgi:hypothetical protein